MGIICAQAVDDAAVTPESLPVIFDVDVFLPGAFDPEGDEVWTHLDELRVIKNDIFFRASPRSGEVVQMIYLINTTSSVPRYARELGDSTPSAEMDRKWLIEVLPHFFAPASRQRSLSPTVPPPMLADHEVEADSPPFTPTELTQFAARGFARKNRWAAGERKP